MDEDKDKGQGQDPGATPAPEQTTLPPADAGTGADSQGKEGKENLVPQSRVDEITAEKYQLKAELEEERRQRQLLLSQQPPPQPKPEEGIVLSEFPTAEEVKKALKFQEEKMKGDYAADIQRREFIKKAVDNFYKENPDLMPHFKLVNFFFAEDTQTNPYKDPKTRIDDVKKQVREYVGKIKNEGREEATRSINETGKATVISGGAGKPPPAGEKPLETPAQYLERRQSEQNKRLSVR